MKTQKIWVLVVVFTCLASVVSADVSMQIKRIGPGIVGVTDGEVIFDLVNTDMTHQAEGFLLCQSPDDAVISSTMGAGTGSGAQYVSPKFRIDEAPSQKAMALSIGSDTAGMKQVSCEIKYIHLKNGKYLKATGIYTDSPLDSDYKVIRLDKTVNFEEEVQEPPEPIKQPGTGFFARIAAWFKSLFT